MAFFIFTKYTRGLAIWEPAVALVAPIGNAHLGVAGLRKVENDHFKYLLAAAPESELLPGLEIAHDPQVAGGEPGLLARLAQGRLETALFFLYLAFGKVPIRATMIQNKEKKSFFGAAKNYEPRGDLFLCVFRYALRIFRKGIFICSLGHCGNDTTGS